jgi:ribosome biogenesis GTPase
MALDLTALGWSPRLEELFEPHAATGLLPARVGLEHTHIYRVLAADGEILARVAGRLRHRAAERADYPAVGDWVAIEPDPHDGDARIHAILPRTSRFSRRAAGDVTQEQIVAANIDTVFLVAGLDRDFNPRRIERYLVVARESGASPVIVLNKADLSDDPDARVEEVRALAKDAPVHAVSCNVPATLDVLKQYLGYGKTGALLGSSGVGKSTIVNRLVGHDLLRTQDVRESDSRGRHTSANRQLVRLPGTGVLIDTPGMRELQLWETVGPWPTRSPTSRSSPPAAASEIASIVRSLAAPSPKRSPLGRCRRIVSRASTSWPTSRCTKRSSRMSGPPSKRSGEAGLGRSRCANA